MTNLIQIVVAEDNDHDYQRIKRALKKSYLEYELIRCLRAEEVLTLFEQQDIAIDILLTDLKMPGISGLELSQKLLVRSVDFPIILLTGEGHESIAVEAMKLGVSDYLSKGLGTEFQDLLPDAVSKAIENHNIRKSLKQSEALNQKLSAALQQSRSGIIITDLDKHIIYVNQSYQTLSGYHLDDLNGQDIFQLMARTTIPQPNMDLLWNNALAGKNERYELKKRDKAGNDYWVTLLIMPIYDDNGSASFILLVEDSIDERRKIEQLEQDILYRIEIENKLRLLKEKEQKASKDLAVKIKELSFKQSALDEHAIVSITDIQGNIIYANQKFTEISQYSEQELLGQNHRMLKSKLHPPEFYKTMWRTIAQGDVWHGEIQNKAKDGSLYWVSSTIAPMMNENNKPEQYISIRTDITETKAQQQALEVIAHYDVLTKLPNRLLLNDRFGQAVAHSDRSKTILAVCFLDIDNFKPVNDRYGHNVGDCLLIDVAKRLKDTIRDEDTVSRHGGDEFILLLGGFASVNQCEVLIERIIQAVNRPYTIEGGEITISASIGYTFHPIDKGDLDTLVRHADHAMYQAKLFGKNTYHAFSTAESEHTLAMHSNLKQVRHAIENEQLRLHFQPKVNMLTGEVFGLEALVRWQHPEKGLLNPIDFLPLITGSDVEIELGNWVIKSALKQLHHWKQQGLKIQVSINVSSNHLLSDSFLIKLSQEFGQYKHMADCIQLEILENSVIGDLGKINQIIKTCQDILGVSIALDDFGTGYSSLTHLKKLMVDDIKIDRSFVRDMLDDHNDFAIIDGLVGLADSFSRGLIAEGVETTEHGLLLINMGCKRAQGFCIARPMPPGEVMGWLENYEPNPAWLALSKLHRSIVERKKAIFMLIIDAWVRRIEAKLKGIESVEDWPVLHYEDTPMKQWIRDEMRSNRFETDVLETLDKLNQSLLISANAIHAAYKQGKSEHVQLNLDDFRLTYTKMKKLLI